jgi:flagellar hook-length control protein FliK
MQIALSSLLARSGPPPSASDAAAADADGFAQLLQQQTPAQRDAAAPGDGADATDERRTPRRTATRTPARTADRPTERPAAREPEPEPGTAGSDPAKRADGDTAAGAPDTGLRDWLAALHLPAAPADAAAAAPATTPDGGDTPTAPAAGTALAGEPAAALPGMAGAGDADAPSAAAGPSRLAARDRSAAARPVAAMSDAPQAQAADATDTRPAEAAAPRPFALDLAALSRPAGTPDAALPSGPTTAPAPASTPAAVALATPLDDPQFPRAFGVQVSVLARDGVQQAELHLNPAEMGPVSVQIVVDGTQARIDFGADAAGTRQLIEHSLPDLAAALREAGLTLTGGGVSQHSAGHDARRDAAPGAAAEGDAAPAAPGDAVPAGRSLRAGGLDLYA